MRSQFEHNGVKLHGVDGRTMVGPVQVERTSLGGQITIEVIVSGLPSELAGRWDALKEAFTASDGRAKVWMLEDQDPLEDLFPGSGGVVITTACSVTMSARAHSKRGIAATVVFEWSEDLDVVSGSLNPDDPDQTRFEGQVGGSRTTTFYSAGRVVSKALQITLAPRYQDSAVANLTIIAVAGRPNDMIFVEIAEPLPDSAPPQGMRISISGTTNYNGTYEIVEIEPGGVVVDIPFTGTETGNANLGYTKQPAELYNEQRDEILAFLGVGEDGKRNETTGLTLAGESVQNDIHNLTVTLQAEWVYLGIDDAIRTYQTSFGSQEVPEWSSEMGEKPVIVSSITHISVNLDEIDVGLREYWLTIKDRVVQDVKNQYNGPIFGPFDVQPVFDLKAASIAVTMEFVAENADVRSFSRSENWSYDREYLVDKDWAGDHYFQEAPGPWSCVVAVTVTQESRDDRPVVITPPTQAGFTFMDISLSLARGTPRQVRNVGEYIQVTETKSYLRLRLRTPGSARVRGAGIFRA
jgi:hypothetical protein